MYYKEGDWESVLFPCLSVRLAIVYFFLLFHISDVWGIKRSDLFVGRANDVKRFAVQ